MISIKAKRTLSNRVRRGFAARIALACFLILLAIMIPRDGLAEAKDSIREDPASNEEFLRESARSLLARTFADFPEAGSRFLLLKAEEEHPANWLLEDELVSYLLSLKYQVSLHSAEGSDDLPESWSLFHRIIEMNLGYLEIRRRGFLGKRLVTRKASLNLSFRLEDNATGEVLWTGRGKDERSELIKKSMAKSLNNESYPILSPSLPDDPQSKFLEPALVAAVVGGLIYLFFANR
jgi:hypothetical protein